MLRLTTVRPSQRQGASRDPRLHRGHRRHRWVPAMNGWIETRSAWWLNLRALPTASITLPGGETREVVRRAAEGVVVSRNGCRAHWSVSELPPTRTPTPRPGPARRPSSSSSRADRSAIRSEIRRRRCTEWFEEPSGAARRCRAPTNGSRGAPSPALRSRARPPWLRHLETRCSGISWYRRWQAITARSISWHAARSDSFMPLPA